MNVMHLFIGSQSWTDGVAAVVGLVEFAAICGLLFRRGYLRRGRYWTAHSWNKFLVLLGFGFAVIAVALAMAFGVDHGVYDHLNDRAADLYFYLLVAFAIVGPGLVMGLLIWFARGRSGRAPDDDSGGAGVPAGLKPRTPVFSASAAQRFPNEETA